MKMNELTLSERIALDKLNAINLEIESNEAQSLSNVCWGYLHHKFDESLLSEPKTEIKKKLKHINEMAPRIITSGCADIFDYREGKIFIKPPVIKGATAKIDAVVKQEKSVKEVKTEIKLENKPKIVEKKQESKTKKDTTPTKLFADKNLEAMMAEQLTREALKKQESEIKKEKVVMNTLF